MFGRLFNIEQKSVKLSLRFKGQCASTRTSARAAVRRARQRGCVGGTAAAPTIHQRTGNENLQGFLNTFCADEISAPCSIAARCTATMRSRRRQACGAAAGGPSSAARCMRHAACSLLLLLASCALAAAARPAARSSASRFAAMSFGNGTCFVGPPCAFRASGGCINATLTDSQVRGRALILCAVVPFLSAF